MITLLLTSILSNYLGYLLLPLTLILEFINIKNYYFLIFLLGLIYDILFFNTYFNGFIFLIMGFLIKRIYKYIPDNFINNNFIIIILTIFYQLIVANNVLFLTVLYNLIYFNVLKRIHI